MRGRMRRATANQPARAGPPRPLRARGATAYHHRCTQYHCSGRTRISRQLRVVGPRVAPDRLARVVDLDRHDRRLEAQHLPPAGRAPARRRQHRGTGRERDDREAHG